MITIPFQMDNKAQIQLFNYIGISMRACSICHELKIPSTEPSWKTYCKACYAKKDSGQPAIFPANSKPYAKQTSMNMPNSRICTDCGQAKISREDPSWKVRCIDCWRNNKGGKPAAKQLPVQTNDDSDGYCSD